MYWRSYTCKNISLPPLKTHGISPQCFTLLWQRIHQVLNSTLIGPKHYPQSARPPKSIHGEQLTSPAIIPIYQQRPQNPLADVLPALFQRFHGLPLRRGALHNLANAVLARKLQDGPQLRRRRHGGRIDNLELKDGLLAGVLGRAGGGLFQEVEDSLGWRRLGRVEECEDVEGFVLSLEVLVGGILVAPNSLEEYGGEFLPIETFLCLYEVVGLVVW